MGGAYAKETSVLNLSVAGPKAMSDADGATPETYSILSSDHTPPAHLRPTIPDRIARPVRTDPIVGVTLEEIEASAQLYWTRRLAELHLGHHNVDALNTNSNHQISATNSANEDEDSAEQRETEPNTNLPDGSRLDSSPAETKLASSDVPSVSGSVQSEIQSKTDKRG